MANIRQLPKLPGYSIKLIEPESFPRPHTLEIRNGVPTLKELSDDQPAAPMNVTQLPNNVTFQIRAQNQKSACSPYPMSTLPSWISHSNHVLRFYSFFKEAVHESSLENWRVRRCVILLYLEDGSIQVNEVVEPSSGLSNSEFVLKRHRIPLDNSSSEFIRPEHIIIGGDLQLYGRILHIYDADEWTKKWMGQHHSHNILSIEGKEQVPIDPFHSKNEKSISHESIPSVSRLAEVAKGKPTKTMLKKTFKMLANMQTVLRFWASLEPPNSNEALLFQVRFFVADDTLEVCRERDSNLGYDMPTMFLRRQPLPKNFQQSGSAQIGTEESDNIEYISETDLQIGSMINIYGRYLRLQRCDQFTKNYYKSVHGRSDHELKDRDAQ